MKVCYRTTCGREAEFRIRWYSYLRGDHIEPACHEHSRGLDGIAHVLPWVWKRP